MTCKHLQKCIEYTGSSRMNVKSNKVVKIDFFMFELFRHLPSDPNYRQIYYNATTVLILSNFVWFQSSTMAPLQMGWPPTYEVFLGHFSLWNEVWNVSRMKELALTFPKMLWKSQIGPKMTELESLENYQLSQKIAAAAAAGSEAARQGLRCLDLWKLVIFNAF